MQQTGASCVLFHSICPWPCFSPNPPLLDIVRSQSLTPVFLSSGRHVSSAARINSPISCTVSSWEDGRVVKDFVIENKLVSFCYSLDPSMLSDLYLFNSLKPRDLCVFGIVYSFQLDAAVVRREMRRGSVKKYVWEGFNDSWRADQASLASLPVSNLPPQNKTQV